MYIEKNKFKELVSGFSKPEDEEIVLKLTDALFREDDYVHQKNFIGRIAGSIDTEWSPIIEALAEYKE